MKKLLIVVDYQNDFVSGSLGFPEAEALATRSCTKKCRTISTQRTMLSTPWIPTGKIMSTRRRGGKLPIPHCLCGSEGWQLHGRLRYQLAYCTFFEKNTFGSLDLLHYLEEKRYDVIELVGVVSNICVISNAILAKAAQPEAQIIVDAQCVASNDPAMQEKAFDILENLHIDVANR